MEIKPDASEKLRSEASSLLAQLRAQLSQVQQALSAAGTDASVHAALNAAASQLSGAESDLSQAVNAAVFPLRAADLRALAGIAASAKTTALLAEATAQSHTAEARAQAAAVTTAAAETRTEVQRDARDIFDRKIFDPYLRFSSREDEQEFRKREAETKKYIDVQLSKKTPEGDLNAGGGTISQMLDAHSHGAGASPEFMPRWNAIADKAERQRAAMHAAGQSTEEYDRHTDESVRRYLKQRGLSDADISARLSGDARPVEVVKRYFGNDRESQRLVSRIADTAEAHPSSGSTVTPVESSIVAPSPPASASVDVAGISAKLKAAGVTMSSDPAAPADHGLSGSGQSRQRGEGSSPPRP